VQYKIISRLFKSFVPSTNVHLIIGKVSLPFLEGISVIDGPSSNFFKYWHHIFFYRHSLARTIESELHPDGVINIPESGSIRLRRCSTIEAPNEALLFEDNAAVVDVDKPRTRAPKLQRQSSMEEMEKASCKLEPRIEGRIVVLNEDTLPHLLSERQAWEKSVARPIRESSEN
jgi:hypothetical protein